MHSRYVTQQIPARYQSASLATSRYRTRTLFLFKLHFSITVALEQFTEDGTQYSTESQKYKACLHN